MDSLIEFFYFHVGWLDHRLDAEHIGDSLVKVAYHHAKKISLMHLHIYFDFSDGLYRNNVKGKIVVDAYSR